MFDTFLPSQNTAQRICARLRSAARTVPRTQCVGGARRTRGMATCTRARSPVACRTAVDSHPPALSPQTHRAHQSAKATKQLTFEQVLHFNHV